MEVFPRLLPDHNRVSTVVSATCAENGNGFSLLWEVMALAVPGFDPTLHDLALVWEDFLVILDFAHAHILYFRLQAKVGLYYNSRKKELHLPSGNPAYGIRGCGRVAPDQC